jgi:hypothetical protein
MSDSEHESFDEMIVDGENDENDQDDQELDDEGGESSNFTKKEPRQVYLPGNQMKEDESLVFDPSAYHMLHDIDSGILQYFIFSL